MNLAVIGTGYVGLVAGACFAESGNHVTCVDVDENKVSRLNRGDIPIYEPNLEPIVKRNVREGRLSFTTDIQSAVVSSSIVFLAVGTPPKATGEADLSQVKAAAQSIGKAMNGFKLVVIKSTVPIGTSDMVRETIANETTQPFEMVANPEFLKEGAAVEDFLKPDRVIVGTTSGKARDMMGDLYAPFVRTGNPIYFMDVRSAELTKYAANAMLALRISFMNELARLAEVLGADIGEVRRGIGSDQRIGKQFLFPGVGYGGSCFPKDVKALINTGLQHGSPLSILEAVDKVNNAQKEILFHKISRHFGGDLSGKTVAIWGLAFKPNTDDMREAPSLTLIESLLAAGVHVRAFDPVAQPIAEDLLKARPNLTFAVTNYEAVAGADALAIVTEWAEFRQPDFDKIIHLMRTPVLFDGRNIYSPEKMHQLGFTYYSIGRPTLPRTDGLPM